MGELGAGADVSTTSTRRRRKPPVREFVIGRVAEFFFDRGTPWLRKQDQRGFLLTPGGDPIGHRRFNQKPGGGDRAYTLDDVREIAFALARRGLISDQGILVVEQRISAMSTPVFPKRARKEARKQAQEEAQA